MALSAMDCISDLPCTMLISRAAGARVAVDAVNGIREDVEHNPVEQRSLPGLQHIQRVVYAVSILLSPVTGAKQYRRNNRRAQNSALRYDTCCLRNTCAAPPRAGPPRILPLPRRATHWRPPLGTPAACRGPLQHQKHGVHSRIESGEVVDPQVPFYRSLH